ncbi:MAG TPA: glycosyltransferase family 2 protein [Bacteroidales bacterium]|nr:glycosyltransferase family 2 protein [Bacteroidales bacterium]HPF02644.1 glycosyltransferase family 2 protein [Bacteroidales bacterium]HPJ59102.1 glycosyltransferase family 2 protein [Bacteroidales bacterium]HPR11401.1 glycosyltransferase family 2 protein [Bacteroidales bacterium]HRW85283.1 glycosyltransferase family 2 protein [Bacteroidales bacterium]
MSEISAVIIAYNEEQFIERCLASLKDVADEIVVVDSLSTDNTASICSRYNVKFCTRPFEGYVQQKTYATSLASFPWVLSIDADEALSEELRRSILDIKNNLNADGYIFNRLNNYCGKWIRHSRWYPDRHLRLFNREKGRWTGINPHDFFRLNRNCRTKRLKGDLLHWYYSSIEEHVEKMNSFSSIGASELFRLGRKAGACTPHIHLVWSFFRSYILRGGFLDGQLGYTGCMISAMGSFLKYAKLRKMYYVEKTDK